MRTNGTRSTCANPSSVDGGSSSRSARIWDVGASRPGSRRASLRSSSGRGQRAEPIEQPLDQVDLRLRERRVEPDAPRPDAVAARGPDHVAPCAAREVRVVEDDPPGARRQLPVEGVGERAQGSTTLVAVEAEVPTGDVAPRRPGSFPLPGSPSRARRPRPRARVAGRGSAGEPSRTRGRSTRGLQRRGGARRRGRRSARCPGGGRPGSRSRSARGRAARRARPRPAWRLAPPRRSRARRDGQGPPPAAARRAASGRSARSRPPRSARPPRRGGRDRRTR